MSGKEGRQAAMPTGVTRDEFVREPRRNSKPLRQGDQA